jgi:hypothetical protein
MPTDAIMKKSLFYFIATGFVMLLLLLFNSRSIESVEILNSAWQVKKNKFKRLKFSCLNNNELILPQLIESEVFYPVRYNYWSYQRKGLFNGQIIIDDKLQNFFSGVYDIEILNHQRPVLVRLYSDSIEIFLKEQYFSIGRETIELEPFINE